jgi:hypothetical protein
MTHAATSPAFICSVVHFTGTDGVSQGASAAATVSTGETEASMLTASVAAMHSAEYRPVRPTS